MGKVLGGSESIFLLYYSDLVRGHKAAEDRSNIVEVSVRCPEHEAMRGFV